MSYQNDLTANNAALENILATVNALPDAVGGGNEPVEWIDVFSLPTTYIIESSKTFYIEKNQNFQFLGVRFVGDGTANFCFAVQLFDEIYIHNDGGRLYIMDEGDAFGIDIMTLNGTPVVSQAEYIMI